MAAQQAVVLETAPPRSSPTRPHGAIAHMAVNPELERCCAKRMSVTTYDIDSSHVPMPSHPDYVIDVIGRAANAIQEPRPGKHASRPGALQQPQKTS
jgi:hypothetical protein